ncbi:hypothetical protein HY546_03765 [archaeon]|nr:hypothetical protein [archaeon]
MRLALAILLLVVSSSLAEQAIINVDSLSIVVSVSRAGDANVTEDYRLSFGDDDSFRTYLKVRDAGSKDLASWQNLTSKIDQNVIGSEPVVASQRVGGFEHLVLTYQSANLAQQVVFLGKLAVFQISGSAFKRFSNTSTNILSIPERVSLRFIVEDTRKSREDPVSSFFESSTPVLLGPYEQQGTVVFFGNGPFTANDFSLTMRVERTLSESLSLDSLVRFLSYNQAYAMAIAVLAVLAVVFRKQVFGALSEITSEEEIQPPKKDL